MFSLKQGLGYVQNLAVRNARTFKEMVDILPEIQHAIKTKQPVVALESTIITHGMPYPQNLKTADEVEHIIRSSGALPATIAILDGRIKVGLTQHDLTTLAEKKQDAVIKCSRRDLAYALAKRHCAGTTVAATMIIARMAGLRIFATGGIGGVHREGHITMDISADLTELGRTPMAIVCSGVKSILDIPRTLEYLETQGVCAITYSNEDSNFPDFYTRDSGCRAPYNVQTAADVANIISASHKLSLTSGLLIAVPIPHEYEANKALINAAIEQAYATAKDQGVEGKAVTPFILAAVAKITGGSSLQANMALIKNNASVAAKIACELSRLENENKQIPASSDSCSNNTEKPIPLVIGASILDLSLTIVEDLPEKLNGATYNTQAKQSAGGVGRNLAEGIYKLYGAVNFLSVVGADHMGKSLLDLMQPPLQKNVRIVPEHSTSLCSIIFDKVGDCKLILGNMEIHNNISADLVQKNEELLSKAPLIIVDANLSMSTLTTILQLAKKYQKPVFFEPTDMRIAHKPFSLPCDLRRHIKFISPNVYELKTIVQTLTGRIIQWQPSTKMPTDMLLQDVKPFLLAIQENFDCIVVTLGSHGVLLSIRTALAESKNPFTLLTNSNSSLDAKHMLQFYAAPKVHDLTNVSGAGDSFSSGFITGLLRNYEIERAVALGFIAAERALKSASAVPNVYFSDVEQLFEEVEKRHKELQRQTI